LAISEATGIRRHILDAAEQVIKDYGMKHATTRVIAKHAGCAEGSIYRYFPDKHALIMEIIKSRYPAFLELVSQLPERVGKGTVRRNLEELAVSALVFYRAIIPMVAGTMAEPKLLHEQRRHFEETKSGPTKVFGSVTAYVRGEQRLGRISDRPAPEQVARLLLGGCFSEAFMEHMLGEDVTMTTDEHLARELVRALFEGLNPRKGATS
jgi:AcrR family transcriptional regulator